MRGRVSGFRSSQWCPQRKSCERRVRGTRAGGNGAWDLVALRATGIALSVLGLLVAGAAPVGAETAPQAGAAATVSGDFPIANDVRVGGDAKQTRFVVDLNRRVEIHAFTLPDPYRSEERRVGKE